MVDEKIYATNDLIFNGLIIEKIGNTSLLFGLPCVVVEMPPWHGPLRCYSDNEISYQLNNSITCDTIITFIKKEGTGSKKIIIYPNPVNEKINICMNFSNKKVTINIFNIFGQRIINEVLYEPREIDVKFLTPGIYYLVVINKNGHFIEKFLKL